MDFYNKDIFYKVGISSAQKKWNLKIRKFRAILLIRAPHFLKAKLGTGLMIDTFAYLQKLSDHLEYLCFYFIDTRSYFKPKEGNSNTVMVNYWHRDVKKNKILLVLLFFHLFSYVKLHCKFQESR